MTETEFEEILGQVPPDYYEKGVKTNLFQRYWHTRKWNILKEFIPINSKKSIKLLDIGCADGTTTTQISKMSNLLDVTGIDYFKGAVDHAKKRNSNIKFVHADVHKLPFKDASYEMVTAIETLEHLKNPNQAFREIFRILKPRGYLIIGQDTNSLLFRLIWFLWTRWRGSVWKNSHISCMRPKDLMKVLKKQGFKVEKSKIINFGMEIFIKARKDNR